jgi:HEAT repeat protein
VFRLPSDPYLLTAFWAALTAVVLTLGLSLAILVLRVRLLARQREWTAFVARWRPLLLAAMLEPAGAAQLPALARREQMMFLRLWAYLHESVRGEAGQRLNAAARAMRVDARVRTLLARGSRADKLIAVLAAGYLRDGEAWHELVRLARGGDSLLSVNAARALVRIDGLRAANALLPLLVTRHDWDLSRVAAFLAEAEQAFWLHLAKVIPHVLPRDLPRALLAAEALRIQLPDATLARLLRPEQPPEVVQAALRLCDNPTLATAVRRCLGHEVAAVRAQAARQMAAIALPADVAQLSALLDDAEWPVRMAAAHALGRLPFLSNAELEAQRALHPRAADVLRQVQAERGLG